MSVSVIGGTKRAGLARTIRNQPAFRPPPPGACPSALRQTTPQMRRHNSAASFKVSAIQLPLGGVRFEPSD